MDNLRNEMETMRVDFNKTNDELAHAQFETERLLQAIAEKDTVIAEKEAKIEELKTSTAKHETTLKKMKAQFQTKLKTMKEKQMEHEVRNFTLEYVCGIRKLIIFRKSQSYCKLKSVNMKNREVFTGYVTLS